MTAAHRKPFAFGAAVLLMIPLLYMGIRVHDRVQKSQVDLLSSELSDKVVPPIAIENQMYEVRKGEVFVLEDGSVAAPSAALKVLRVGYFFTRSRDYPFFALDGTDPERLKIAAEHLRASVTTIAENYPASKRVLVLYALYPIDMYHSLADLQEMREQFISSPSDKELFAYSMQLERFSSDYVHHIGVLRRAVSRILPNYTRQYAFTDTLITKEEFLEYLDGTLRTLALRKKELSNLRSCVMGYLSRCSHALREDISPQDPPPTSDAHGLNVLPEYITEHRAMFVESRTLSGAKDPEAGAIVFLMRSACLPHFTPIAFEARSVERESAALTVNPLNDIYLFDLSADVSDSPYFQKLKERGMRYIYQAPTNPYLCFTGADDYMRIASLVKVKEELSQKPLLAQSIRDSVHSELSNLEQRIVQNGELSESDVLKYVSIVGSLVKTLGEYEFTQTYGDEALARAKLVVSIAKNLSGSFDKILEGIVKLNRAVLPQVTTNAPGLEYIFVARSMPRLTLLFANPSFLGPQNRQDFSTTGGVLPDHMVSYRKNLKGIVPRYVIIEAMAQTRGLYLTADD
ncbi:hypothetical protein A3A39_02280 [Candidatus Kaiserbacteria bacterium RIFCSPLOWO2_01_FULL_54_13]|uniref:Uncharacterized protein n=1 Tax=Candidatus Kaiserbacteria bacterium RIFCSPLOWO2_01_FULL_54_13 TaxID=1798512 RepID=A0A1F6F198_9BACT|nr:MAG: hypothetical protein A3A39_02280 [Candidatus Kaiserbacteria bacterium RIFCSPLOWO2_01_FULL_54_13]